MNARRRALRQPRHLRARQDGIEHPVKGGFQQGVVRVKTLTAAALADDLGGAGSGRVRRERRQGREVEGFRSADHLAAGGSDLIDSRPAITWRRINAARFALPVGGIQPDFQILCSGWRTQARRADNEQDFRLFRLSEGVA